MHEPAPLRSLQTAFAPQGDGSHGWLCSSLIMAKGSVKKKLILVYKSNIFRFPYVGFRGKLQKDRQYIQLSKYTMVYDLRRYNGH